MRALIFTCVDGPLSGRRWELPAGAASPLDADGEMCFVQRNTEALVLAGAWLEGPVELSVARRWAAQWVARKYLPEGGNEERLKYVRSCGVRCVVRDGGYGLALAQQEAIPVGGWWGQQVAGVWDLGRRIHELTGLLTEPTCVDYVEQALAGVDQMLAKANHLGQIGVLSAPDGLEGPGAERVGPILTLINELSGELERTLTEVTRLCVWQNQEALADSVGPADILASYREVGAEVLAPPVPAVGPRPAP